MGLKLMTSAGETITLHGDGVRDAITLTVLFVGEQRCQIEIDAPRETVQITHHRDPVSPRKRRQINNDRDDRGGNR
jgi:sRNA-binding carbon storage regulator CsrA